MQQIDFWELLDITQEYITTNYALVLTKKDKLSQLKNYIEQFLRENEYEVVGVNNDKLIDRLYSEMAEYSVLTAYLGSPMLEEINVNAWNDIALTYRDGTIKKAENHFHSPQHSVDIIKRLLHHSGMIIDNSSPIAGGHLPNNTRITALKEPIVDENVGVSCSIRLLHPNEIDREKLISSNFATKEMVDFLTMCIRYGVSLVVAGVTSSGKTTLLNALLQEIPDNKRIVSIESGSRELSLVRNIGGKITNNVVHTLSRPSDNSNFDITQEDLVVASLRFSPNIIVVGEMRDSESYSAVEASLTGHTVVSTVHASGGKSAHTRIALLCQKRFSLDFNISLIQAGEAFPIVVYAHRLENNQRKIMDISECEIMPDGSRQYHSLYKFDIIKNTIENCKTVVEGNFVKVNVMSDYLKSKLKQGGISDDQLKQFLKEVD